MAEEDGTAAVADEHDGRASTLERTTLTPIDSTAVCAILEDCIDQLIVLGTVIPKTFETRSNIQEFLAEQISQVVQVQRGTEQQASGGGEQGVGVAAAVKQAANREKRREVRDGTHRYENSLAQNPLSPENLDKLRCDRDFVQKVMSGLSNELKQSASFSSLATSIDTENARLARLKEFISREEELKRRIRSLQKQIDEVNRQKETELQERAEMLAHLKDQLQETKAKTSMEERYVKKLTDVTVAQTQHQCKLSEDKLEEEKKKLTLQLDEEQRVHNETEQFLRIHEKELEQKLDLWTTKYEKEVDALQNKLDTLKSDKARDLDKLERMTRTYEEYEKIVNQDKVEKERARRKAEREANELRATLKIQSWWRMVMAKRGIGLYAPKKKKKGGKKKKK